MSNNNNEDGSLTISYCAKIAGICTAVFVFAFYGCAYVMSAVDREQWWAFPTVVLSIAFTVVLFLICLGSIKILIEKILDE